MNYPIKKIKVFLLEIISPTGKIKGVEHKNSFIDRILGLMFRKEGRILMEFSFQDFYGVWMPFMRFPIDIAFISREKEIVDLKKDVKPIGIPPSTWRIYRPEKMCKYILEVESGLLEEKGFSIGDELKF